MESHFKVVHGLKRTQDKIYPTIKCVTMRNGPLLHHYGCYSRHNRYSRKNGGNAQFVPPLPLRNGRNRYVTPHFETLVGIDQIEIIQSTKLISVSTHGKLMRGNNCHMVSATIRLHVYELHFDGCWKEDQFSLGSGVGTFNNAYGSGCQWIGEGR